MGNRYQQWWERLSPFEREHTTACVQADDVDDQMLTILSERGPVGLYGVQWRGTKGNFIAGPFVEFVTSRSDCC